MKERYEISKVNKSIGGNKRIGGTFCSKLINEQSQISARDATRGGAGGAAAPPGFGRSVNPISTRGG